MTRLPLFVLFGLLAACGDKEDTTDDSGGEADTDTDTDADTDTDTDTDTDLPTMTGTVSFSDGTNPEGMVRLQMCQTQCFVTFPDSNGNFTFQIEAGDYAFDAVSLDEDTAKYSTPLDMVTLPASGTSIGETVVIYDFTDSAALQAGDLTVGDLTLTIDPGNIELPLEYSDAAFVAGVEVDASSAGLPLADLSGTVVGMWYLGPFKSKVDWDFSVATTLPDDAEVVAYNADYEGIEWEELGTATVKGGMISGLKLKHLSTLVLVQP